MHTWRRDVTQLISGANREGEVSGLAWVGTVCKGRKACGVVEDLTVGEWSDSKKKFYRPWQGTAFTMTHEMGHNFGMHHDGSENDCDPGNFIMAAYGDLSEFGVKLDTTWSNCSRNYIENFLQTEPVQCLDPQPRVPVGGSLCGDGIVSKGEECDLGPQNGKGVCTQECKKDPAAECAKGACCNTNTGLILKARQVRTYSGCSCKSAATRLTLVQCASFI